MARIKTQKDRIYKDTYDALISWNQKVKAALESDPRAYKALETWVGQNRSNLSWGAFENVGTPPANNTPQAPGVRPRPPVTAGNANKGWGEATTVNTGRKVPAGAPPGSGAAHYEINLPKRDTEFKDVDIQTVEAGKVNQGGVNATDSRVKSIIGQNGKAYDVYKTPGGKYYFQSKAPGKEGDVKYYDREEDALNDIKYNNGEELRIGQRLNYKAPNGKMYEVVRGADGKYSFPSNFAGSQWGNKYFSSMSETVQHINANNPVGNQLGFETPANRPEAFEPAGDKPGDRNMEYDYIKEVDTKWKSILASREKSEKEIRARMAQMESTFDDNQRALYDRIDKMEVENRQNRDNLMKKNQTYYDLRNDNLIDKKEGDAYKAVQLAMKEGLGGTVEEARQSALSRYNTEREKLYNSYMTNIRSIQNDYTTLWQTLYGNRKGLNDSETQFKNMLMQQAKILGDEATQMEKEYKAERHKMEIAREEARQKEFDQIELWKDADNKVNQDWLAMKDNEKVNYLMMTAKNKYGVDFKYITPEFLRHASTMSSFGEALSYLMSQNQQGADNAARNLQSDKLNSDERIAGLAASTNAAMAAASGSAADKGTQVDIPSAAEIKNVIAANQQKQANPAAKLSPQQETAINNFKNNVGNAKGMLKNTNKPAYDVLTRIEKKINAGEDLQPQDYSNMERIMKHVNESAGNQTQFPDVPTANTPGVRDDKTPQPSTSSIKKQEDWDKLSATEKRKRLDQDRIDTTRGLLKSIQNTSLKPFLKGRVSAKRIMASNTARELMAELFDVKKMKEAGFTVNDFRKVLQGTPEGRKIYDTLIANKSFNFTGAVKQVARQAFPTSPEVYHLGMNATSATGGRLWRIRNRVFGQSDDQKVALEELQILTANDNVKVTNPKRAVQEAYALYLQYQKLYPNSPDTKDFDTFYAKYKYVPSTNVSGNKRFGSIAKR